MKIISGVLNRTKIGTKTKADQNGKDKIWAAQMKKTSTQPKSFKTFHCYERMLWRKIRFSFSFVT